MMNGQATSYQAANEMRDARTDWTALPKVQCSCGQTFYAEVVEQTQCRDCHAVNRTGFYV
jgi:hypothetical protein